MVFLLISFYTSFSIGQVHMALKWGQNFELNELSKIIQIKGKKIVNSDQYKTSELLSFYQKELYIEPEWHWKLAKYLPKKNLLKMVENQNYISFSSEEVRDFRDFAYKNEAKEIIYIVLYGSNTDNNFIKRNKWLYEKQVISLKNKKIYLFKTGL